MVDNSDEITHWRKSRLPEIPRASQLRDHCYLCGKRRSGLQKEHIIPKVVFKPFHTSSRITLKCCPDCHELKSRDDEYVSRAIQATSFVPESETAFSNLVRGFERQGAGQGLRNDFIQRFKPIEWRRDSGLYMGKAPALHLDSERVDRYCERISKGLWVRYTLGIIDWDGYDIDIRFQQVTQGNRLMQDVQPFMKEARFGEYWRNIISYFGDCNEHHAVWCLIFYGSHLFVVSFGPSQSNKSG